MFANQNNPAVMAALKQASETLRLCAKELERSRTPIQFKYWRQWATHSPTGNRTTL